MVDPDKHAALLRRRAPGALHKRSQDPFAAFRHPVCFDGGKHMGGAQNAVDHRVIADPPPHHQVRPQKRWQDGCGALGGGVLRRGRERDRVGRAHAGPPTCGGKMPGAQSGKGRFVVRRRHPPAKDAHPNKSAIPRVSTARVRTAQARRRTAGSAHSGAMQKRPSSIIAPG